VLKHKIPDVRDSEGQQVAALSVLGAALEAFVFLREPLTLRVMLAAILIFAGMLVLVWK